jgi:membrane protein required for colicin V production
MTALDFLFLAPLAMAAWCGYRKGLLMTLVSLVALIFAVIACMKLTHEVTEAIMPTAGNARWAPFAAYLLVFAAAYYVVYFLGRFLNGFVDLLALGFVDKIAGGLLGFLKAAFMLSLFFWLSDHIHLFKPDWQQESLTYSVFHGFAPQIINVLTPYLPYMKGLLQEIAGYFKG